MDKMKEKIKLTELVISDFTSRRLVLQKGQRFMFVILAGVMALEAISGILNHGIRETALFFLLILPIGCLTFFHEAYPTALSPAMYLVPLNKEEKLEYLRCCYIVKLLGVNMLYFVINLALILPGWIPWWSGFGMELVFLLLSFPMGAPKNVFPKQVSYQIEIMSVTNSEWKQWLEILYLLAGICSWCFFYNIGCEDSEAWVEIGLIISLSLLVFLLPWMIRNVKRKFSQAENDMERR